MNWGIMHCLSRLGILSLAIPTCLVAQTGERDPVLETARTLALTTVERIKEQSREPRALEGVWLTEQSATTRLRAFGPTAVPLLTAVMNEPDSSHVTRSASAFALASIDPDQADTATAVLIEQIHAMGFSSQQMAPSLLVALGQGAVPQLVRHISDPVVIEVLADMRTQARAAVPALIDLANHGNLQAAVALIQIGTPEAITVARPVLVRALEAEHWQIIQMAVTALGQLRRNALDLAPRIDDFLEHPVPEVRIAAAVALVDIGATGVGVRALERLVMDTTVHSRYAAMQKLTELGPQARLAADGLLQIVEDEQREPGERAASAIALSRIAPTSTQFRAALREVSLDARLRSLVEEEGVVVPNP